MFTNPIKHTRLTSMDELCKFSYRTKMKARPYGYWQYNGQIAFADQFGIVWITPYRAEILPMLKASGYSKGSLVPPFSNEEEYPENYGWLEDIANQENWAETYEKAFEIASERGIKPVKLKDQKLQIKEVIYGYQDGGLRYERMTEMYLSKKTADNIATYIIVDEKTLAICDEYGRTFVVKTKTVNNDIVNALIDAGYTRTAHPEKYIIEIH